MSGVSAIHHALRHVHSRGGQVRLIVHILDQVDRAAVDAHAQGEIAPLSQRAIDRDRTARGSVRAGKKGEHHPIARRNAHQFVVCFGGAELLRLAHDAVQLLQPLPLLISPAVSNSQRCR